MKTGSKRGAGSATGSGVLDAPGPDYAPERDSPGRGPGPAGTLSRPYSGYADSGYPGESPGFQGFDPGPEEMSPRARRGSVRIKVRRLPRSLGGRILLGVGLLTVLAALVITAVALRFYAMHDSRFIVATSADIQISGDEHLSRDQVLSVFGDDIERNIFAIPLDERREDLERLPWIAHATVMRLLPNHIRVLIAERTPVAFVRQGSHIGLVDASGVLLDMPPDDAGDPNYSFPVLTGISAGDPLSTRAARLDLYRRFMGDLDSGGQKLSQTVSEVDVSDPEDVKALIASDGSDILVHFGDEQFLHRYREFAEHLAAWKRQYPDLASADMRYEGQIVLEMQKREGAPPAGDGASAAPAAASAAAKATGPKRAADPKPMEARGSKGISTQSRQSHIEKQAKIHAAASSLSAKTAAMKNGTAVRTARAGGGTTP